MKKTTEGGDGRPKTIQEKESYSFDFEYNKYPDNPFSRTNKQKLFILLGQIDDISDRIQASPHMRSFLKKCNKKFWSDREDEAHNTKEKSQMESKLLFENLAPDCDIRIIFDKRIPIDLDKKGEIFTDSDENVYPARSIDIRGKYEDKGKYNYIQANGLIPEISCTSKFDIKVHDIELALEYIAYQLFISYIDLEKYEIVKMLLDSRFFPCLWTVIYIKKI